MLLQTTARALLLGSFGLGCIAIAAPSGLGRHLPADIAAATGLAVGYATPLLAALAAPRMRRADLTRASLMLLGAMALFLLDLHVSGAAAVAGLGLGALMASAPAALSPARRRMRDAGRRSRRAISVPSAA